MGFVSRCLRALVAALVLALLLGAGGGALFVWLGMYNISALEQHSPPVFWLMEATMQRSLSQRAQLVEVPDLAESRVEAGFIHYRRHCEQCHGGPGVAPQPFAMGMRPVPDSIINITRQRRPEELYWTIVNGVKMTGMPAWRYRLSEDQIWSLVAFLVDLPGLSPLEYRALTEAYDVETDLSGEVLSDAEAEPSLPLERPGGAVERGREAIQQYGCATCHRIPGITAAVSDAGPPLAGIADRAFIAGILPNTAENMVRWLRFTSEIAPDSAMPELGVEAGDARDITAYLGTLREYDPAAMVLPGRGL